MHPPTREEFVELSKKVVELQFQLSLVLLELERRPLQQSRPANDDDHDAA
jgi:hypothetical protein